MARLDNARWEKVAQLVALGQSEIAAYTAAGYKPNRSHASRLVANGSVRARIAELQEEAAKNVVRDRQWVLDMYAENAEISMGKKRIVVARSVMVGRGKNRRRVVIEEGSHC